MTETTEVDRWVVIAKRYGGGTSVIDISENKETAEKLAEEFNTHYQTDNYFVRKYEPERHLS